VNNIPRDVTLVTGGTGLIGGEVILALARCGQNQSLAARRLQIGRNTLTRKLHEHHGGRIATGRVSTYCS